MTEATERLEQLYGPPASPDQIRLYFETFIQTYVQEAEKQPPDVRESLGWYTHRPLRLLFYVTSTTICFALLGDADAEVVEQVDAIERIPTGVVDSATYLTGGTSLNGKKLYGIDSAIREAVRRLRADLRDAQIPGVRKRLDSTAAELRKVDPDIRKLREGHAELCSYLSAVEASGFTASPSEGGDSSLSPFSQVDYCPLLTSYGDRLQALQEKVSVMEERLDGLKERSEQTHSLSRDTIQLLKDDRSHRHVARVNTWVIAGILASMLLGVTAILLDVLQAGPGP